MLKHSLETGAFLAPGGIRLVAAITFRVVDFAAGGLLRGEAKFGVRLAPLDVASGRASERQQDAQCSEDDLQVKPIQSHGRKSCKCHVGLYAPRRSETLANDRANRGLASVPG